MSPRSVLKQRAKESIKASRPSAILVFLVYAVVVVLLEYLAGVVSGYRTYVTYLVEVANSGGSYYPSMYYQPSTLGSLLSIAINIMISILSVGCTSYALSVSRMVRAGFVNLLDGFSYFLRALWLGILMGIFIWLWSLLLIVPGIVAAYRYSQAYYIMLDNPDMPAIDCIRASKELMYGHKWEKFVLDLSFILWGLLCIIPIAAIWVTP